MATSASPLSPDTVPAPPVPASPTATTAATASLPPPALRVPIPRKGVDYRGKLVLAPMVRSGECPSRLLALHYGADLVWGPETIDKALIGCTRRVNAHTGTVDFTRISSNGAKNPGLNPAQRESVIYRLHPQREGRKLIYQIGTANPDTAVQAARLIAPDVVGIDVNAGCPKPFSTSGGMGAALLKTPDKLAAILRALVTEVGAPYEIGISVKIRLLDTPAETEALVRQLCQTGITGLTIHCRTTPMRPRQRAIRAQLRMIASTCHEYGVACLMNGDVTTRDEAAALMAEYGVDGAMIATAAETNPSCFRAGSQPLVPWHEVVREYVRTALEVENKWGNTKYLLGQMIPGKQSVYKGMTSTKSYSELINVLGYEEMAELAKRVDSALEIGTFATPGLSKAEKKKALKEAAVATMAEEAESGGIVVKTEAVLEGDAGVFAGEVASKKRSAAAAGLDMPPDVARSSGPGTVSDHASILAV